MSHSLLDAIGNTPLVKIQRLNPNPRVTVLAKLEYFNPGGSIKDRAALYMIRQGEESGELTPDKTVIEATSGNTGIGLALICGVKGYKLLLAMSEAVSEERRKILKARGAEILLTPGHLGTDGAIEEVYRLARENPDAYFMSDQYNTPANWMAHYEGTAVEIWEQTEGKVTDVVATMGTTGTLMGISRRMAELNPQVRVIGVEPYLGHKIQGLKNMKEAYCPEIYEKKLLTEKVNIDDEDAFEMTRRLAREEGIFVGMSSGAAMHIALKRAEQMESGVIVAILPDSGERYLSTKLFTVREKVDIRLFNTLTRSKEPFVPNIPGKAAMYSCGPTAHARMNLIEARRFTFADLLVRYLEYRGFDVTHVMNITDLDDKTIEGAENAGMALADFTGMHIGRIMEDFETLGVRPADRYPRASEHVDDMVDLAGRLVKKGAAYEKLRSLYFDISRFSGYGRLSGVDLNKIRLGATVDLDEYEKENPRDFTLLKRATLAELKKGICVKTEWGNVRPSWHIQCAAMSMKYLGESFDIHTSSRALIFPHHENEIAIAGAVTGKPLAKYWLHCDQVMVDGRGAGDVDLGRLLEKGFSGREIRFWLLMSHYRKPVTYSDERLEEARRSLRRFDTCLHRLCTVSGPEHFPEIDQLLYDLKTGFTDAMDDDLNVSAVLACLFGMVRRINSLVLEDRLHADDAAKILDAFAQIDAVLNIFDTGRGFDDPEVRRMIAQREEARKAGDFALADRLRDQLLEKGLIVCDPGVDA